MMWAQVAGLLAEKRVIKQKQNVMAATLLAPKKVPMKVETRVPTLHLALNRPSWALNLYLGMFYDIQRKCLTYPQDAEEGFWKDF